jgi:hypothetical protein
VGHDYEQQRVASLKQGSVCSIDYRCSNRRFCLSSQNCQVPTPTSLNLELEQQIRIFGADKLINCLEDWHPQFLICRSIYQKKGKFWEVWGWGLTICAG